MSSVQGDKPCPRCGGVMWYDFNCSTQEEWRSCTKCGLSQEWRLDRDENGRVKCDDEHPWGIERYHEGGVGLVVTTGFDGNGRSEVLTKRPSYRRIKQTIKEWENNPYIEKSECYIGLWNPKRHRVDVIYGKRQPSYDEACNEAADPLPSMSACVTECAAPVDNDVDNDLPF